MSLILTLILFPEKFYQEPLCFINKELRNLLVSLLNQLSKQTHYVTPVYDNNRFCKNISNINNNNNNNNNINNNNNNSSSINNNNNNNNSHNNNNDNSHDNDNNYHAESKNGNNYNFSDDNNKSHKRVATLLIVQIWIVILITNLKHNDNSNNNINSGLN